MTRYSGSEWIKASLRPESAANMSPLGEAVADLLGAVFRGIYHLRSSALRRVEWDNDYVIQFIYDTYMSTWDTDAITALVVLSHDRLIRMEISGCGPHYMRLTFHQRTKRGREIMTCLPTMERHIEMIRNEHGEPKV